MTDNRLIKVALVMPVFNRCETTLQGLRSLSRVDRTGLNVRIFVVDDGSTDGTSEEITRQFPEIKLIQGSGDLHYAAGTNRGIEASLSWKPDYIVIMNDDAIFHERFLKRLIASSQANQDAVVGSLLLLWDQPHKVFQVGLRWSTYAGGWKIPTDWTAFSVPREAFEVECLVGNCVLIPTAAITSCGILDEVHFPYGWGDVQYTSKLRRAGWKLLVEPKSLVWCEPNTNPIPLHYLTIRECASVLLKDSAHPMNLRRQFVARWHSAPTKRKAMIAFLAHNLILLRKSLKYVTGKMIR